MKLALFAAAAVLAAPAVFAQSTIVYTDTTVLGAGPAAVVIAPANSPVSDFPFFERQNSVVAAESILVAPVVASGSSTAVMGASAAPVVRYWWNVPSNIASRQDFRRWRGLL
jgi:hypothetical protein